MECVLHTALFKQSSWNCWNAFILHLDMTIDGGKVFAPNMRQTLTSTNDDLIPKYHVASCSQNHFIRSLSPPGWSYFTWWIPIFTASFINNNRTELDYWSASSDAGLCELARGRLYIRKWHNNSTGHKIRTALCVGTRFMCILWLLFTLMAWK